jgi:hypothetical protein
MKTIEEMAKAAGFVVEIDSANGQAFVSEPSGTFSCDNEVRLFAALVAERCAQRVRALAVDQPEWTAAVERAAFEIAREFTKP